MRGTFRRSRPDEADIVRHLLPLLLLPLAAAPCRAQLFATDAADRYETGRHLNLFERALEKSDAAGRKRAVGHVEKTTMLFFSGKLGEVAENLDLGRYALASDKPPADEARWAESLAVRPASRLFDRSATELPVSVAAYYRLKAKIPEKAVVRLTLGKATAEVPVKGLPLKHVIKLTPDDRDAERTLTAVVEVDGKPVARSEHTISFVEKLDDRLAALETKAKGLKQTGDGFELASLKAALPRLKDLANKKTLETNYPVSTLLKEAEDVAAAVEAGERYYGPKRAGQFWLSVGSQPVRVQVPAKLDEAKRVPLVVALHGAGGTENLFFDGYGDGKTAKLCAERGWMMAATRAPLLAFAPPDVPKLVSALAKTYPIDTKKVFLVGHSMGAGHAVALGCGNPDRVAAVAALGGGGAFRASDAVKDVPFFVGCGDKDFLLNQAEGLHKAAEKAGVKKVKYVKYEDADHLMVVQLAARDVFAFFDEAAK